MADTVYTAQDVAEYKSNRPDSDVPFKAGDIKVQVYACPRTAMDQIFNTVMNNNLDITDLQKGHNMAINKSGKGILTKYTVSPMIASTPCDLEDISKLIQLDKVGYTMSYDEMLDLLTDGVGGEFVSCLPGNQKAPKALTETTVDVVSEASTDDLEKQMLEAFK